MTKKNEFTIPSLEQIIGDHQLEVIKKFGSRCAVSDYAILEGATVSNGFFIDNGSSSLKDRAGSYRLSNVYCGDERYNYAQYECEIGCDGRVISFYASTRDHTAIRPILYFPNSNEIYQNGQRKNGIWEYKYGNYPVYAVAPNFEQKLDYLLEAGKLKEVNGYTTDFVDNYYYNIGFKPVKRPAYEYNGHRYIRVKVKDNRIVRLSNGKFYYPGDYSWIEVLPLIWLYDEKAQLLISKIALISGIHYCRENDDRSITSIENSSIYKFLNKYFAKEIMYEIVLDRNKNPKASLEVDTKLHPMVYTYLAFKEGSEYLKTKYYDNEVVNWQIISKILYETNELPNLGYFVKEETAKEMVSFYNQRIITIEDIIQKRYDKKNIKTLTAEERYAAVLNLYDVEECDLPIVRSFIADLGLEFKETFDDIRKLYDLRYKNSSIKTDHLKKRVRS